MLVALAGMRWPFSTGDAVPTKGPVRNTMY